MCFGCSKEPSYLVEFFQYALLSGGQETSTGVLDAEVMALRTELKHSDYVCIIKSSIVSKYII